MEPALDPTRYVVFLIGEDKYASPLENVAEISRIPPVTPVPRTDEFVVGVANLRGNIVTILDLKPLLGIPEDEDKPLSGYKMLILGFEGLTAAIVVDRVEGVVEIGESELEPPLPGVPEAIRPWIPGQFRYGESLIGIIDPAIVAGLRELLEKPA